MNQSSSILKAQPEDWKYSPVRLIPENYDDVQKISHVVIKKGENTSLVTEHLSSHDFARTTLEICVAENAVLTHWHLFNEASDVAHIDVVRVNIERNGRYQLNALTIGAKWSRSEFHVRLLGEGAECELNGLDVACANSIVERHIHIEHLVPHTTSAQLFKGIVDEAASSSFFGKIKVAHKADGTKANQINRSLLLSEAATANTRPQLEIDTDEVACTHGATVGQLDEAALFFLRSRGLSEVTAKRLLTEAFAKEVLDAFGTSTKRLDFETRVLEWFGERGT